MDKQDFIFKANASMTKYRDVKKRIEFLTVGQSHDIDQDIMKKFQQFLDTMTLKGGFPYISDYIGCVVNHNHIHVLIKKPYILPDVLRNNWQKIAGINSNITCKTVKPTPEDARRVINYIANQGNEHETDDIKFFDTPRWGITTPRKMTDEEKQKRKDTIELNKIRKSRLSESNLIYDTTTGKMREKTEEDDKKSLESFKKWTEEKRKTTKPGDSFQ